MQIDLDLLFTWGAIAKEYKKAEVIFNENETANFYYQIADGNVRMFNSNDEGKEFTQGNFSKGDSFGEPPLFISEKYPSTAIACQECRIIKLGKDKFLNILEEYPAIQKQFLELICKRLHAKSKSTTAIINQKPEYRIMAFLKANKKTECDKKEIVPFTRQEIANFTGLRVETVIRTFSKMRAQEKIDIVRHKIFY